MSVQIRLLGVLKTFQPSENEEGWWEIEAQGKTIEEILSTTNLSKSNIGYIVLVNGIRKSPRYILKEGDKVNIMPLVAGG